MSKGSYQGISESRGTLIGVLICKGILINHHMVHCVVACSVRKVGTQDPENMDVELKPLGKSLVCLLSFISFTSLPWFLRLLLLELLEIMGIVFLTPKP